MMDEIFDILAEVLNNLSFTNGFRDIRKKTKSKFLRCVLYVAQVAVVLLLALAIAVVIFLLYQLVGALFS